MSLDVNLSESDDIKKSINLYKYIKLIAADRDIQNFDYTVDYVSSNNVSYIANIFKVKIKDNRKENNTVNVVVKTLLGTVRQEHFHELYKREVKVYSEVIPEFNLVLNNLNYEDRIVFPRCLLSSPEKGEEVIILEDMIDRGFENNKAFKNYELLKYDTVCAALKKLAEFHALSIILRDKNSDKYSDLKLKFPDMMFDKHFLNITKNKDYILESYQNSVKEVINEKYKQRLSRLEPKLFDLLRFYIHSANFNVFCHGDYWINNILFKNNENKIDVCMLDFQVLRYANPATDIMYFLYLCTDSMFRSDYKYTLLKNYYRKLTEITALANIDLSIIYPEVFFEVDKKVYAPFGVLMAMIQMKLTIPDPEEDEQLKSPIGLKTRMKIKPQNTILKIKINDLINESAANGVLGMVENKLKEM